MSVLSSAVFEMISDPSGINLSLETNPRVFSKVFLKDSLLNFFPCAEIMINDKQGILVSVYTFIEGMKFATKLGFPEEQDDQQRDIGGYLVHDYSWAEDQINNTKRDSDYISGTNCMVLISDHYFKDCKKTTAYQQQPSDIAKKIAQDVFKISDAEKIFIDTTTNDNNTIWYQGNRTYREFLEQTLVKKAYSSNILQADKSPFVSFINCAGEFYFCSYETLYKQTPVATFECYLKFDKVKDPFAVQEIMFATGGAPLNKKLYNQEIHFLSDTGEALTDILKLENQFLTTTNKDKFPVNKNQTANITDINSLGLFETGDEFLRTANESFLYQNSMTAFRMEIVVNFNAKLVSGKTIGIKIKDFTNEDEYSTQLSGTWLIVDSEHRMDRDACIYSHLVIARPSISFNNSWNYLASVLG
jgi:hypothetical protein